VLKINLRLTLMCVTEELRNMKDWQKRRERRFNRYEVRSGIYRLLSDGSNEVFEMLRVSCVAFLLIAIAAVPPLPAGANENSPPGRHSKIDPVPEGYHTITPYLIINGAAKAIEFYKKAFGAQVETYHLTSDGRVMHAEVKIGDSIVMICDDFSDQGVGRKKTGEQAQCYLHLYVADVDSAFDRVVRAGAKVEYPLANQFWGDRYGSVVDPFGQGWTLASHIEDVPASEIEQRAKDFFKSIRSQTDDAVKQSISPASSK
jgi:PhnB protein